MKKKEIEKIPYLTVPETMKTAHTAYACVTACMEIRGEKHILLEVYRNRKQDLQVPVVRYAATRNDWGVYFPESGEWTRQRIASGGSPETMCWNRPAEYEGEYGNSRKSSRLYSQDDMQTIEDFFNGIPVWDKEKWWSFFYTSEAAIKEKAREKRYHKRAEKLKERVENTPPLPEQEILSWADRELFREKHFLYYRKKNRRMTICCSACGGVTEGVWRAGESSGSLSEKILDNPVNRKPGTCPLCGKPGEYKPQGKADSRYKAVTYAFTGDRYGENGAVIRYVQIEKRWILNEALTGESGNPGMTGAYEKLSGVEIARTYFEQGKKVQTDYNKYSPYTGENFWDDCNLQGLSNISIKDAALYPGLGEKLKGTFLQYSAIELYAGASGEVNAAEYMTGYIRTPQIEMLVRMKLYGVVRELCRPRYGIVVDAYADRPEKFLGIRRERMKLLAEHEGDVELLELMQTEKRMGQNWTVEQLTALKETGAGQGQIRMALGVMTLQKMLNRISKYAGCGYGTGCFRAEGMIRHTATTYLDYLSMRAQLGYDLGNTVYQNPKDLEAAHTKMMQEIDKKEQDRRLREASVEYPEIRQKYRKLRSLYYYEDDLYTIRPARSAEEIVQEGRILHHCVGGDNYLSKHSRGESTILMLRRKEMQETPYITVEIRDCRILQWYGDYNKKPDEKNMQEWLDTYVTRLKSRSGQDRGQQTAEAAHVPA